MTTDEWAYLRGLIKLSLGEGTRFSISDIATETGLTEKTVKELSHRLRPLRWQKYIDQDGGLYHLLRKGFQVGMADLSARLFLEQGFDDIPIKSGLSPAEEKEQAGLKVYASYPEFLPGFECKIGFTDSIKRRMQELQGGRSGKQIPYFWGYVPSEDKARQIERDIKRHWRSRITTDGQRELLSARYTTVGNMLARWLHE